MDALNYCKLDKESVSKIHITDSRRDTGSFTLMVKLNTAW